MDTATTIESEGAVRLRSAVLRLARRLRRTEAGGGLAPSATDVLGSVVHCGDVAIGRLAELEQLNPTMLSRIVGNLEGAGLVTRRPDATDARSVVVTATPAGRRLQAAIRAERTEILASALGELEEDDRRSLDRALPVLEQLARVLRAAGR